MIKFAVCFSFESTGMIVPLPSNESIATKILGVVKVMLCLNYHYLTILFVYIKYSSGVYGKLYESNKCLPRKFTDLSWGKILCNHIPPKVNRLFYPCFIYD